MILGMWLHAHAWNKVEVYIVQGFPQSGIQGAALFYSSAALTKC